MPKASLDLPYLCSEPAQASAADLPPAYLHGEDPLASLSSSLSDFLVPHFGAWQKRTDAQRKHRLTALQRHAQRQATHKKSAVADQWAYQHLAPQSTSQKMLAQEGEGLEERMSAAEAQEVLRAVQLPFHDVVQQELPDSDTLLTTAAYLTDFSSRQPKTRKRPINAQQKRSKPAQPTSSSGVLSASDRPLDASAMLALSVLLEEMVSDASEKHPLSSGEKEVEGGQLVPSSERETEMVHLPDRL